MNEPPVFPQPPQPAGRPDPGCISPLLWVAAGVIALWIFGLTLGPINHGIKKATQHARVNNARIIELAMFSYANDHEGKFPDGKSSTEVFQKLLDGNYLSEPSIFSATFPEKRRPNDEHHLSPESVAWDVTSGVDMNSPESLPVVFMTGFKVSYVPSARMPRTWEQWWNNKPSPGSPGIAVAYRDTGATFIYANPDGTLPGFVPPGFDPKGRVYLQLTPDGLPPKNKPDPSH